MSDKETDLKHKKNYLGASSLMFAIFAVSGCWIPFFNVVSISAAIAGLLLGAWSLARIFYFKLKGIDKIVLSSCGVLMSVLAIAVAMSTNRTIFYSYGGIRNFVVEVIDTMAGKNIGEETQKSSQSGKNSSEDTDALKKVENQSSYVYKIGETAELSDRKITLNEVQKNFNMNNEYSVPREGSQFIKVTIKVENSSDADILVSPQETKIEHDDGVTQGVVAATYLLDDQFETENLASGGTKEGAVIFEIPENYESLRLTYQPSSSDDKAEFDLQ